MTIKTAISALKGKQAIISRTDDDHWLYEPIATVLEELETYRRALELACEEQSELQCCIGLIKRECDKDCNKHWADYYIKKAREENDD